MKRRASKPSTPAPKPAAKSNGLHKLIGYLAARTLVARYDSLDRRKELRYKPEIRTDLSETEQVFQADRRILAYLQADDLYDNGTIGSTIDSAIRLTIGDARPIFTGDDREMAEKAFSNWAKRCGWQEDESLPEILAMILRMVKLHGDCLVWCDPDMTQGKVRLWDADQICNVSGFEGIKDQYGLPEDCRQVEGVVVSNDGRVLGYLATFRRNHYAVSPEDAVFLPASCCMRASYHKKHTQFRGEPSILANQEITEDTKDLLKAEIGAAKLAAEMPLVITKPENDAAAIGAILDGFPDSASLTEGTDLTDDDLAKLSEVAHSNDTFKAFTGKASIAEVPAGTGVTNLNNSNRPSQQIQSWVDLLNDTNGKALGMMSCLSRGRADNSYSSGQIELAISWQAFKEDQRLLERVIAYLLDILLPGSEFTMHWPEAFSIDPEKDEKVKDMRLRGGRMTLRDMLGPNYIQTLDQLAYEKKLLEERDLTNLSFFQTASGGVIADPTPTEPTEIPQTETEGTNE